MRYVLYDKTKDGTLTLATGKNDFGSRKHAEKYAGKNTIIKREKTMPRKKKRSAKQLANDRRLGRMAKARAKAKRGGRRKVTRKKVARKKNVHATRRRTSLKKSHLWFVLLLGCSKIALINSFRSL